MSQTMTANADTGLRDWPFLPSRSMRVVRGEGAWLIGDDGRRILDAAGGAIVVSGLPSLLPTPALAQPPQPQQDAAAANQLQTQLPEFFTAYANGNTTMLNLFLAPGASLAGLGNLGNAVQFKDIAAGSLHVPQQSGATRNITVTVDWQLTGQNGGFAATYDMTVVDQQGGRWYVEEIRASTQPLGTAP